MSVIHYCIYDYVNEWEFRAFSIERLIAYVLESPPLCCHLLNVVASYNDFANTERASDNLLILSKEGGVVASLRRFDTNAETSHS